MRITRQVVLVACAVGAALGQDTMAARQAFDRGDYALALRLFEAAQGKHPECANLLYIGLSQHRLSRANDAIISFQAAVKCDGTLVPGYLALGDAHLERGNENEALAAYLQALSLEPKNPAALRAASALFLRNNVNAKAQPLLQTLVEVEPKDKQARADLAALLAAGGNRDAAEGQYLQALKIDAQFFPALTGLGNLYLRSGDTEGAIALLEKAAGLKPNAFEPHFLLGSAQNRLGHFEAARAELQRAIELGGGDEPQVYYHLARAYGGLGNGEGRKAALARFSELTRREKEDVEAQRKAAKWVDEARSFVQSGDLRSAIARLDMARETRPGDASILFRLAGLHYDLQQLDLAREYVQAAISISPAVWLHHFLLGLVEKSSGQWDDARQSLETAAKLNPGAAEVFNALGEVATQLRDWNAAIDAFERASNLAPGESAYRQNLESARKLSRQP